jgi:hypothetical protein
VKPRKREIGVRMTLGAKASDVVQMVVGQAFVRYSSIRVPGCKGGRVRIGRVVRTIRP